MTIPEAYAAYVIERDDGLDELHPFAGDYPDTSISWHRERDKRALDAAVKDVALAAVEATGHSHEATGYHRWCAACRVVAEIERLFEGGKK